jgi:hypothetical protein
MPRKQAWEKNIEASGGREAVVGKCHRYAEHVARMVQDERFPTLQLYFGPSALRLVGSGNAPLGRGRGARRVGERRKGGSPARIPERRIRRRRPRRCARTRQRSSGPRG